MLLSFFHYLYDLFFCCVWVLGFFCLQLSLPLILFSFVFYFSNFKCIKNDLSSCAATEYHTGQKAQKCEDENHTLEMQYHLVFTNGYILPSCVESQSLAGVGKISSLMP